MCTTCVAPSVSSRSRLRSRTSPWTKRRFGCSARSVPVSESRCRLSRTTSSLSSTSRRASEVPMNPAPPVSRIFLPLRATRGSLAAAHFATIGGVIAQQLARLVRHSAVYGLGAVVSRLIGVLLLPLVTRYLTRAELGAVDTLIALSVVLVIVMRAGISMAFFRFYFDAEDEAGRTRVVRTSFWYTMGASTTGLLLGMLLAPQISELLFATHSHAGLVRAAFVLVWAQMNYEQLTSLFRVEERSAAYVAATLANVLITVGATVLLVAVWDGGALGVLVGNFTGTLVVYFVLLAYRRFQLGLEFDRGLFRQMQHFGLPLVPSGIALWVIDLSDRFFLVRMKGLAENGLYSIGVRISTAILLLLIALRTAWPAFAYSIKDDDEAKRTYGYVLTYALFVSCWLALALSLLAPWLLPPLAPPALLCGAAR